MDLLMQGVARFAQEEEGATMVEYGLMVALIAIVCIGVVTVMGEELMRLFGIVGDTLAAVPPAAP